MEQLINTIPDIGETINAMIELNLDSNHESYNNLILAYKDYWTRLRYLSVIDHTDYDEIYSYITNVLLHVGNTMLHRSMIVTCMYIKSSTVQLCRIYNTFYMDMLRCEDYRNSATSLHDNLVSTLPELIVSNVIVPLAIQVTMIQYHMYVIKSYITRKRSKHVIKFEFDRLSRIDIT